MSTRTKIIAAVVIGGALLLGAYLLFFNTNSTGSAITEENAPASAAEVTFLNLASKTDSITFDTTVLTDPRFTSLVDTRTSIVPVPQGRRDPFSPIAGLNSTN